MSSKKNKKNFSELKRIGQLVNQIKNITSDSSLKEGVANVTKLQNELVNKETFNVLKNYTENFTKITIPTDSESNPYKEMTLPLIAEGVDTHLTNKNLIVGYLNDFYGCGHFRILYPFNNINAIMQGKLHYTTMSKMITQEDILATVQAFWFQRPLNKNFLNSIKIYKKYQEFYQYKLICEIDDYLFELPEWNNMRDFINIDKLKDFTECLRLADEVVVSTVTLKNELIAVGIDGSKIRVILNTLPKALFGTDSVRYRFTDVGAKGKPSILYNGSASHFNRETNDDGDLGGVFKEFLLKYVNDYQFLVMGTYPSYMDEFVDKGLIKVLPYYNMNMYPFVLRNNRVDFIIAPLKDNIFNSCKSDLKYLEASAIGTVFIGSEFEEFESPYTNAVLKYKESDGVEYLNSLIVNSLPKEAYNAILEKQYAFISSRWTENTANVEKYLSASSCSIVKINPEDVKNLSD